MLESRLQSVRGYSQVPELLKNYRKSTNTVVSADYTGEIDGVSMICEPSQHDSEEEEAGDVSMLGDVIANDRLEAPVPALDMQSEPCQQSTVAASVAKRTRVASGISPIQRVICSCEGHAEKPAVRQHQHCKSPIMYTIASDDRGRVVAAQSAVQRIWPDSCAKIADSIRLKSRLSFLMALK